MGRKEITGKGATRSCFQTQSLPLEAGAAAPASSSRHPKEKSEGHLLDNPKIVTEQDLSHGLLVLESR